VHEDGINSEISTRVARFAEIVFAQSHRHFVRLEIVDAMRGCENVLISDQNSAAVLIRLVTKQSRHPGPLTRVGWLTTHNPDGLLHQLTATFLGG